MKNAQAPRPHKKPSKKSPTSSEGEAAPDTLQQAIESLRPLMEFQKMEDLEKDNDLRICWDIRIVRGEDTPFTQTTGVSTLPKALSSKMKARTSAAIQQEITSKVLQPLIVKTRQEMERLTVEQPEAPGSRSQ